MSKKRRRVPIKMPYEDSDSLNITEDPELDRSLITRGAAALMILSAGRKDEKTKHAKSLIDSTLRLIDSIEAKKPEEAAMHMLELDSCEQNILMDEKKESSSKGGKAPKKKEGIRLAIQGALEKSKVKTAAGLWRYFEEHHRSEESAFQEGNCDVWYEQDPPGSGEGFLWYAIYRKQGSKDIVVKDRIVFATFKRYVREVKKSLTNHSMQTEKNL